MDSEKKNLKQMLINTVSLLCQNGLTYKENLKIEGVIGVTVDDVVFLVHIDQTIAFHSHNDGHTNDDDDCYVDEKEENFVIQNVNSGLGVLVKPENVVPTVTNNHTTPPDAIKKELPDCYTCLKDKSITEDCDDDVLVSNENNNNCDDCNIIANKKDETLVTKVVKPKKHLDSVKNKSVAEPSKDLPTRKKIKLDYPKSNQLSGNWSNRYTNNYDEYFSDGQINDYNTTRDDNFENNRAQFYLEDENDYSNEDTAFNDTSLDRGNRNLMFGQSNEGGGKIRKSHQCQYPDCQQTFVRKDGLVRHQRTVHGEDQSYQDDADDRNTAYSSFLGVDELTQNCNPEGDGADKLRPHQCQYPDCGRTFIRKDHLVRHQRTFHGKQWGVDSQKAFLLLYNRVGDIQVGRVLLQLFVGTTDLTVQSAPPREGSCSRARALQFAFYVIKVPPVKYVCEKL
ncbi:hypothetical protein HELRODRAFT_163656 [Helobdella robusta]|uniref:C2H2-type domain-containing protein n=1 Tax=Helobdella robusta TaxID=6412 RepID=T1EUB8_HELRO|nr:hypothetical protein HELRODRAFT_163656 [Helobdella robusta]ESN96579.1 hypothetical protein HELRODRAFT_163656 [Helobdella robusta]